MAIDANIALGYKPPDIMGADERQANAQKLQAGNIANQTSQFALSEAQSKQKENDQARQIMMGAGGDHVKAIQDLTSAGLTDQAQALQKYADERTGAADTHNANQLKLAHDKYDSLAKAYGTVAQAPDAQIHQVAWQTMDNLIQSGDITPEWAAQSKQQMGTLPPEQLRQMAQTGFQQILSAKEQLPNTSVIDQGGLGKQPVNTNPVTGQVTPVGNAFQVTPTIDQTADNTRQAAMQAETLRHNHATEAGSVVIDPDQVKANAGMLATGMPMSQVLPGYGAKLQPYRDAVKKEAIGQIMADNPTMSMAQAGQELANRSIDFVSGKHSVQQLTTMEGATKQAVAQLDFNINKTNAILKSIPSSDLSPIINAIARGEEKWTGDPQYSSLFYYMHATATESARILAGGQASVAQLNAGAAEEAKKWANVNMTPASFAEVAKAMHDEGDARLQTYKDAKLSQRNQNNSSNKQTDKPAPSDGKMPNTNSKGWVLHTDKKGRNAYVSPDGKQYEMAK